MGIVLYHDPMSPPARAVLLTTRALGLDVEVKEVNMLNGEHLTPEYLKMNPQHTVPTLDDNGIYIWDSHAINVYLVTKYGKDDSLYPMDPQKRAVVDQRMFFDSGVLYPRLRSIVFSSLNPWRKSILEEMKKEALEDVKILNSLIGNNQWVTGNHMTIADFSCIAVITSLELFIPEVGNFPNVSTWIQRCKTHMVGYREVNQDGLNKATVFLNLKSAKL